MNNVKKIVDMGLCTGCSMCMDICENIRFETSALGFPVPVVSENCSNCGKCLAMCDVNPDEEE